MASGAATRSPMTELAKTFDPAAIEARWYAHWEGQGLFRPERSDKPPFTIVMPPPNVTGSLHIGHALDITLQDILVRHARLQGKDALWVVGTDHAGIATQMVVERQLDAGHACALGASYGGYMMNWIEGVWPDRFKCIVQHDGVFDARAMAYETEELWFDEWEHGGKAYYEDPAAFERWNPVNTVANWKTPQLVITSENDFRIPYTQGLATFTALQRRGIPSRLVVYPDENHWVLKPKNSIQWYGEVFGWMNKWMGPGVR